MKSEADRPMQANITPLILCGGIGTRLWPLSRKHQPKQFQRIESGATTTFFQATVERHRKPGFAAPLVAVSGAHLHTVHRQLDDIDCPAQQVISEPISRNTGPAVLAAALHLAEEDPQSLICVLPSDHIVKGDLSGSILALRPLALSGKIVLFGIRPEYPEPGFGYILRVFHDTIRPYISCQRLSDKSRCGNAVLNGDCARIRQ